MHESLGPYRIERSLGAGGMGEVWLATDTRLGRSVAVKVLPAELATDPDRLARFEKEARAAAALNHPHIAAVFDVGVQGDTHYMVQERLEGQTLRERLEAGQLPLNTALSLAAEIAEALAAAHEAGIVHRDLKPENVFVTRQGHAKVLDFGLAKLTERAAPRDGSATQSPTVLGTSAGQILGTAGYMAPEQITGEAVDERADLFAFGCLLYELTGGRRAFTGKNLPEVLHRLANEEPEPLAEAPPELRRIVGKCMAKEPARRYQGADDLVVDLRALLADVESGRAATASGESLGASPASPLPSPLTMAALLLLGALAGAALYAILGGPEGGSSSGRAMHLPLQQVPGLDDSNWTQMALSPDGRYLAFATGRGTVRLWDLHATVPERTIPETEGARTPFFSPDSTSLGYLGTDGRFYRVPVQGGRTQPFTDRIGSQVGAVVWRPGDDLLLVRNFSEPIAQVLAGGSEVVPLVGMDEERGEIGHGPADLLPDGDTLLYSYWDDRWRIGARKLTGGERVDITEGYGPRYAPTGHLVWVRAEQLMAATFDPVTFALGEPVQLVQALGSTPGWGRRGYDFSADGTLAYLSVPGQRETAIIRIEDGEEVTVVRPGDREFGRIRVSPDGARVALQVPTVDGDSQIWSYGLERNDLVPVARGTGWDQMPSFSPDGETILYTSERLGSGDVFVRAADGTGDETALIVSERYKNSVSQAPSGAVAVQVDEGTETGSRDIWVFPAAEGGEPEILVASEYDEDEPGFSPDGTHVAFVSNRSGRTEVYVVPYPGGSAGGEWKVSTSGGQMARWAPDGSAIYFLDEEDRVMRARVVSTAPFRTGPPEFFTSVGVRDYDVAPDGSILAIERLFPPRPHLVLDWFEELERLVPHR